MAKKINFTVASDVNRAHAALLDFHVEHVVVTYPNNSYIVVLNRFKQDALNAFSKAGIRPSHIKNARHYEQIAKNHKRYGKMWVRPVTKAMKRMLSHQRKRFNGKKR